MLESCKTCTHYGRDCILFVMSLPVSDLIAWMRIRKDALRLSNAEIAEASGVPKGTVDRIFASSGPSDLRVTTAQPIVRVLAGCTMDDLTCSPLADASLAGHVAHLEDTISRLEAENKRQSAYIEQMRETARCDIERAKQEEKVSLDYMKALANRRMRIITVLSAVLAVAVLTIFAALVLDWIDPHRGFLWLDHIASLITDQRMYFNT